MRSTYTTFAFIQMTHLMVRRLLVDMTEPLPRHWCRGDAFSTAFFNGLSMSFDKGERLFIQSVRDGFAALPTELQDRFRSEVNGFIGQESTHRYLHAQCDLHFTRQGVVNHWNARLAKSIEQTKGSADGDVLAFLGVTAACEHFTTLAATWALRHPDLLDSDDPRMPTLLLWHASEELEHRGTAFDLHRALGGSVRSRRHWMLRVTWAFTTAVLRQTLHLLWRDGSLFRWSTWRSAASFLFGRRGLIPFTFGRWLRYMHPDFHPMEESIPEGDEWLRANRHAYSIVGAGASTDPGVGRS